MKFNLQYFAENEEVETNTSNVETESEQATLTQEDINRLIAQNKSKAKAEAEKDFQKQINDLKAQYESQLTEVKSKLGDKDREAFDLQTAKAEIAKLQEALDEERNEKTTLSEQITKSTLKEKAITLLNERSIPVTEKVLNTVIRSNAEETVEAIDALTEILGEQRKALAQTGAPIASGGIAGQSIDVNDTYNLINKLKKEINK